MDRDKNARPSSMARYTRRRESMPGVLAELIRKLDTGGRIREAMAMAHWAEAVGPRAAQSSRAERVQNGVLHVCTKSSAWSQELALHKVRILRAMNERAGKGVLTDIRFRASGFKAPPPPPEPERVPTEQELAAHPPTPEEAAGIAATVAAIEDPARRARVADALAHQISLRRWRIGHGWRVCPVCNSVYLTEGPRCRLCAITRRTAGS